MKQAIIFDRHADIALQCLEKHEANKPFPGYLKSFFKANRKFGSKDRRQIGQLCYAWFRVGYSFDFVEKKQQIILAFLLLTENWVDWMDDVLAAFELDVSAWKHGDSEQRITQLKSKYDWEIQACFPHADLVSKQLEDTQHLIYQFAQPMMWLRARKALELNKLKAKLPMAVFHSDRAIGLPLGTSLANVHLEHLVEIQDLSSQMVYDKIDLTNVKNVWDCCCASGGKSLNLLDRNDSLVLFGSDNRKSIISNFLKRTGRHKSRVWSGVVDARVPYKNLSFSKDGKSTEIGEDYFDLILADVPCSGSGTWNRNPEFKYCFERDLEAYQKIQKAIVANAMKYLKPGGVLCYTTCSIFEMENEEVMKDYDSVLETGYIKGYKHQSDSMFYAFVKKN